MLILSTKYGLVDVMEIVEVLYRIYWIVKVKLNEMVLLMP
jgi:hypothetical protein